MPPTKEVPFPCLETERTVLRPIRGGDTAAFLSVLESREVIRYSGWSRTPTLEEAGRFVADMAGLFPSGNGCAWAIVDQASGVFAGAVRFNYIAQKWKFGGVGYELHPDFRGRGLMTEALRAVVACGHAAFGLNRIEAWTLPGNDRSEAVLRRAGFQFEGLQRQKAFFYDAYHDLRFFARLASDPAV